MNRKYILTILIGIVILVNIIVLVAFLSRDKTSTDSCSVNPPTTWCNYTTDQKVKFCELMDLSSGKVTYYDSHTDNCKDCVISLPGETCNLSIDNLDKYCNGIYDTSTGLCKDTGTCVVTGKPGGWCNLVSASDKTRWCKSNKGDNYIYNIGNDECELVMDCSNTPSLRYIGINQILTDDNNCREPTEQEARNICTGIFVTGVFPNNYLGMCDTSNVNDMTLEVSNVVGVTNGLQISLIIKNPIQSLLSINNPPVSEPGVTIGTGTTFTPLSVVGSSNPADMITRTLSYILPTDKFIVSKTSGNTGLIYDVIPFVVSVTVLTNITLKSTVSTYPSTFGEKYSYPTVIPQFVKLSVPNDLTKLDIYSTVVCTDVERGCLSADNIEKFIIYLSWNLPDTNWTPHLYKNETGIEDAYHDLNIKNITDFSDLITANCNYLLQYHNNTYLGDLTQGWSNQTGITVVPPLPNDKICSMFTSTSWDPIGHSVYNAGKCVVPSATDQYRYCGNVYGNGTSSMCSSGITTDLYWYDPPSGQCVSVCPGKVEINTCPDPSLECGNVNITNKITCDYPVVGNTSVSLTSDTIKSVIDESKKSVSDIWTNLYRTPCQTLLQESANYSGYVNKQLPTFNSVMNCGGDNPGTWGISSTLNSCTYSDPAPYTCIRKDCSCPGKATWDGTKCVCAETIDCKFGSFDGKTCECVCTYPYTLDSSGVCTVCNLPTSSCPLPRYSGVDPENCICKCAPGRSGVNCDCVLTGCENGGAFDRDDCSCTCIGNWSGITCSDCEICRGGPHDENCTFCLCNKGVSYLTDGNGLFFKAVRISPTCSPTDKSCYRLNVVTTPDVDCFKFAHITGKVSSGNYFLNVTFDGTLPVDSEHADIFVYTNSTLRVKPDNTILVGQRTTLGSFDVISFFHTDNTVQFNIKRFLLTCPPGL